MAFDEGLAERLRDMLRQHDNVTEKKMFGGLALCAIFVVTLPPR